MKVARLGTVSPTVTSYVFTTKENLTNVLNTYATTTTVFVVDDNEFDLTTIYPVGSIYINKTNSISPESLFGSWYSWIASVNLPAHTHTITYTPKGAISTVNTDHIHNIEHTHDIKHTHSVNAHTHSFKPEGTIISKNNYEGESLYKHTANYFQTISAVDGKLFTLEDVGGNSYSTGDKNTWTDKKPMQKLKLNTEYLASELSFVGTQKNVSTETITLKKIEKIKEDDTNLNLDVTEETETFTDGTTSTKYTVNSASTTVEGMNTKISGQVNTDTTIGLKNDNAISHNHIFTGTEETITSTIWGGKLSAFPSSLSRGPTGVNNSVSQLTLIAKARYPLEIEPPWSKVYIWYRKS